jgi:hypothetical protein
MKPRSPRAKPEPKRQARSRADVLRSRRFRGGRAQDQINLTDEESRILPVSGGGFEQAYNAQAGTDVESLLVVTTGVSQAPNDKEQVVPLLDQLASLPEPLGQVVQLLADTGYYSEKNVEAKRSSGH